MDASCSQTQLGSEQTEESETTRSDECDYNTAEEELVEQHSVAELVQQDSEAVQEQPAKEKKKRKVRTQGKLPEVTQVVTCVNSRYVPSKPAGIARVYNSSVGIIVRKFVKITCMNLRAKELKQLREKLLQIMLNIYKFEIEGHGEELLKKVKDRAVCMMVKALSM